MVEENKVELTLSSNGTLPKRRVRTKKVSSQHDPTNQTHRLEGCCFLFTSTVWSTTSKNGLRPPTKCFLELLLFWRPNTSSLFQTPASSRYVLSVCGSHFSHYSFFHFFFLHRDQPSSGDDQ